MLWLHKDLSSHWNASLIAVNRGLQRPDSTVAYDQTLGGNVAFREGKFSFRVQAYGQFGEGLEVEHKKAFLWSSQVAYYLSKNLQLSFKTDIVSGTDTEKSMNPLAQETNTFDVLYGYRHKYYGHMDYFYLSFAPSTGLEDVVFGLKYKPVSRLTTTLDFHSFYAQATLSPSTDVQTPVDNHLGEEVDMAFEYKVYDQVKIKGGYSHMFATSSMEVLRGHGNYEETANWFWLQASFILKQ
jgi:hypothetical protein